MMKKILPVLAILAALPFVLCSCFSQQAKSMSLSKENADIIVGDTLHITVSVEPDGADAGKISWTSSDNNIVTVDDGTIKGKAKGTAVVTAESESGLKRVCNVNVKDKEVESVTLDTSSVSVKVEKSVQIGASVLPADAPSDNLVWKSSDSSIAVVNSEGFVTGVEKGIVTITCTSPNGKSASCTVTVKDNKSATVPPQTTAPQSSESYAPKKPQSSSGYSSSTDYSYDEYYLFPESSVRKLSRSEVYNLDSETAQDAVNEIYARHGFVFKTKSIQKYYDHMPWYVRNYDFSPSDLSSIENYNVKLFKEYV